MQERKLGFLAWAFSGGLFFGNIPGRTLGSIGAALIGCGLITVLPNIGKYHNAPIVLMIGFALGGGFLAAGYSQYSSAGDAGGQSKYHLRPTPTTEQEHDAKISSDTLAYIKTKDEKYHFPLHEAAEEGRADAVEYLLAGGARVDQELWFIRVTPLHSAALRGRADIVKLLLSHKANIDAKTRKGETPLLFAAGKRYAETARILLENGADVNSQTTYGETPLSVARKNGHSEMVALLEQHPAPAAQATT